MSETSKHAAGGGALEARPCVVCGTQTEVIEIGCEVKPYVGKRQPGLFCPLCGMLQFPENTEDYVKVVETDASESGLKDLRNATDERPGREFHMAQMALEILNRPDITISFFGAGLNTDWKWVQKVHPEVGTKLVDLRNLQGHPRYESITEAKPSDIIIASEVIEHFERPVEHFESLFRLLKDDSLLICSTNVYDGTDIGKHVYPFVPGHVAYWTPMALLKVAASAGLFVDFRTPEIALSRAGPRKKYVLFYRSAEMAYRVALYFGTHMFAPSEQR